MIRYFFCKTLDLKMFRFQFWLQNLGSNVFRFQFWLQNLDCNVFRLFVVEKPQILGCLDFSFGCKTWVAMLLDFSLVAKPGL